MFAINKASETKSIVILYCIDQPTTRPKNRSITTAKYSHASWLRIYAIYVIYVIYVIYNWLGCVGLNGEVKYLQHAC